MQYDITQEEKEIKEAELLVLVILGKAGGKISILHLQKIFFFIWKFHPSVKRLVNFVPHLKGPYSYDLDDIIKNPLYVAEEWEYMIPLNRSEAERVKGGYLEITEEGKSLYEKIIKGLKEDAKKDDDALALISAVDLIVPLYTKLEWDELLFLLYTDETNKDFSKKSELSRLILGKSEQIIGRLIKKGIIPEEKRESLIERAKDAYAWWVS